MEILQPPIRAILFDKDGTLLDFDATWARIYMHAAEQVAVSAEQPGLDRVLLESGGLHPETGRFASDSVLACEATPEIARLWAQIAGLGDAAKLADQLERLFCAPDVRQVVPVPALNPALIELRAVGYRMGVATMDSEAMAHGDLRNLGVHPLFEFICGADSGHGVKPDPGMVAAFCKAIEADAGEVVMVGDTPHDLHMGRNAGAGLVIGVLTGTGERADLEAIADHVITGVEHLPRLFAELKLA